MSARTRWLLVAVLVAWLVFRPNTKAAQVVAVQRADPAQSMVATGRVNAMKRVDVGSEVTVNVLRVAVREGDRVAKGALLVQLNDTEARARLARLTPYPARSECPLMAGTCQADRQQATRKSPSGLQFQRR